MVADTTNMTSVVGNFITSQRKTPKNMTKRGWGWMTQTSMPEVHTVGKDNMSGGGGGWRVNQVELVRAVTSVEYHTSTGVLHRKTTPFKFNSDRIFTSNRTNRDKSFNEIRRD